MHVRAQALFRRAQLKALVDIHSQSSGLGGGYLSAEEIGIIRGALDMTGKKAFVGMTPLDKVLSSALPAAPITKPARSCMQDPLRQSEKSVFGALPGRMRA
jgi:hypothetical protein